MGIISELFDMLLETRSTESKIHIGTVDRQTGEYKDYQTSTMSNSNAQIIAERMNREIDRKVFRGEIREKRKT